jgi:hypothetical protein
MASAGTEVCFKGGRQAPILVSAPGPFAPVGPVFTPVHHPAFGTIHRPVFVPAPAQSPVFVTSGFRCPFFTFFLFLLIFKNFESLIFTNVHNDNAN